MIEKLKIKNFKSIKSLDLDCSRINLFIGNPNAGKSNILEALGVLSHMAYGELNQFVRFENMTHLFYDHLLDTPIELFVDDFLVKFTFEESSFKGHVIKDPNVSGQAPYGYNGSGGLKFSNFSFIKYYKYTEKAAFAQLQGSALLPPFGDNLMSVVMGNNELKSTVKDLLSPFNLKVSFKPLENRIEVTKFVDDVFVTYPYKTVSDTLKRMIFHLVAIESNKDAVICFEEPESHAFPYYTKFLAERIAQDNHNQYFIVTHNPYLLLSLIEKTPTQNIAVFATHLDNFETKVRKLTENDIAEIKDDVDPFFNIERYSGVSQ